VAIHNIKQTILTIYDRFIKLKGAPREIALGFALGLLIGMTPFFGMHFFSSLLLASLLGWSKIAALVGVNITNVLTAPLIYPVNYWVGVKLAGFSKEIDWSSQPSMCRCVGLDAAVAVDPGRPVHRRHHPGHSPGCRRLFDCLQTDLPLPQTDNDWGSEP
jgi:hypothetical protein